MVKKMNWEDIKKQLLSLKDNIYFSYTLLFILFFLLIFSPFIIQSKSFLWIPDGISQHYSSLTYMKEWLGTIFESIFQDQVLNIPFWTLKAGFGQDVIGNIINFRLFNMLFAFFDESQIEFYFLFRTFISLYLCGLSFICFASTKSKHKYAILIGCMAYLFCGYSLYVAPRHTFFLEMMFYFPLLLRGVDLIFEKKRSYLFIFIVFLSCISYIYFLYMITLPAVIYALFKYFETRDKQNRTWKDFLNIVCCFLWQYLFGVALSAFSLFPALIRSLGSSRTGAVSGLSWFHWDLSYYFDFIKGFINIEEFGSYGFIAISGLAVFCIVYMFVEKFKEKNIYVGQFLLYTVVFLVPFAVLVFNGFMGRTLRWCYVYSFWIAMIVVIMLPRTLEKRKFAFNVSSLVVAAYLCIYLLVSFLTKSDLKPGVILYFVYFVLFLFINYARFFKEKKQIIYILLSLLCLETMIKSYTLFSPKNGYITRFADTGKVVDMAKDNPTTALQLVKDKSLYRVDSVLYPIGKKYDQKNYGLRNNVNAISSYFSFTEGNITNYSLQLGNSQQNVPFLMLDFDQRAVLNSLASVKYLTVTDSSLRRVPYGYKLLDSQVKYFSNGSSEKEYLYLNENALPFMYTYSSYIPYEQYEEMDAHEKEQAMLQGAVLKQNIDYPKTDVQYDHKIILDKNEVLRRLRLDYADSSVFEIHDDYFIVKDDDVEITLTNEQRINGEINVLFINNGFEAINQKCNIKEDLETHGKRYVLKNFISNYLNWSPATTSTITAKIGIMNDTGTLLNNNYQYYFGKRDLLLNIGNTKSDHIKIKFSRAGVYSFDDIKVIVQPMDNFKEKIDALKTVPVTDILLIDNGIKGKLSTDKKRLVTISIPYSKGWTAYINGKETDIMEANGMYMAVMAEAGVNEILLKYETPGFMLGVKISIIAFFLLLIIALMMNTTFINKLKKAIIDMYRIIFRKEKMHKNSEVQGG